MVPTATGSSRKQWSRSFPYQVDYNDHFETPRVAYEDILPLIDCLSLPLSSSSSEKKGSKTRTRTRKDMTVYDPYYCNGRTKTLLEGMGGFGCVVHECRDFYQDQINGTVPHHDILITNPPYSDSHKEKCLRYCLSSLRLRHRPFFVLLPNYVAAKEYYQTLLHQEQQVSSLPPPAKRLAWAFWEVYTHQPTKRNNLIFSFDAGSFFVVRMTRWCM